MNFFNFKERSEYNLLENYITKIEKEKENINTPMSLYIDGDMGSGKTTFVKSALENLGYDVLEYDSTLSGVKNLENLFYKQIKQNSIINIFNKKKKQIVILIDNIQCINKSEKGVLNDIIIITRPKKTKTQKLEKRSYNPVICIGENSSDKKLLELKSKSYYISFSKLCDEKIKKILLNHSITKNKKIIKYINGDLHKLKNIIYSKDIIYDIFLNIEHAKHNIKTKDVTKKLLSNNYSLEYYNDINETDRTSIGLLYHENLIDLDNKTLTEEKYIKCLDNFCYADNIDRITFQKQIWSFNERSALIKILYNNLIVNSNTNFTKDIRFTKILTKYSTEYNNKIFLIKMSQKINVDIDELLIMCYDDICISEQLSSLEINRLNKFLNMS